MTAPQAMPSLSVVIPVYNEPEWIGRSVSSAVRAIKDSPFADDAELVIVDDGSAAPTKEALGKLSPGVPMTVLEQGNSGRFAARRAGIDAARGDLVLMLDSRVTLAPDALRFVASQLDGPGLPVWNAHVHIDTEGNPFARFWRVVAHAAWPDYLRNPRTMTFGLEDFDRYPKGTTCFLAPRTALQKATDQFHSLYEDLRFSNDDTVMIRAIAREQPIHLSPGFACHYHARDSLPRFLRHTFHRGTVFVDGFGRPGTRYFPVIAAFFPASAAFLVLTVKRPQWGLAMVGVLPLAAGAGAIAIRRPPADALSFALLSAPFAASYSAGIWRGGFLAARKWLRRR